MPEVRAVKRSNLPWVFEADKYFQIFRAIFRMKDIPRHQSPTGHDSDVTDLPIFELFITITDDGL